MQKKKSKPKSFAATIRFRNYGELKMIADMEGRTFSGLVNHVLATYCSQWRKHNKVKSDEHQTIG